MQRMDVGVEEDVKRRASVFAPFINLQSGRNLKR